MATATVAQIGYWRTSDDSFQPHPNSPTGAILNLNDGTTLSLLDTSGTGTGLDLGQMKREVLTTGNPRTTGSRVTSATYRENREIKLHLVLGPTATFAVLQTAIHTLIQTCRGITNEYPGALQFQSSGMANPVYFDILEAHVDARFQELLWIQNIDDSFEVTLTCKPFGCGARVWLQNLVNNPGAEAPSGPGVTVFNDPLTNLNAYQTAYIAAVLADSPVSFWKTNEASGTTMKDSIGTNNGTTAVGVTVGQAAFNGETDLGSYSFSSSFVDVPYVAALNTSTWSIEAWVNPSGGAGTQRTIMGNLANFFGIQLQAGAANNYAVQIGNGASFNTVQGGTATVGSWAHVVATFTGGTLTLYVNGASVASTGGLTFVANTTLDWLIGETTAHTLAWPGTIGPIAIYNTVLSSGRVSAHYSAAGSGAALTQDKFTYLDAVIADAPLRYYRLDEASGTTARDAMFSGNNGTYTGTPTLGVAGALTSDPQSDTAITLNGTTDYVTAGGSGLPTGNAAHALDVWVKIAGNPAATAFVLTLGDGNTAGHFSSIQLTTAGKVQWSNGTSTVTAAAALSLNTWHHVGMTYDGTTVTLEADGIQVGTATPANTLSMPANAVMIGARFGTVALAFLTGSIDEAAVYGTNIGLTRLTAHYNAGHNAPSVTANTLAIPSGVQVAFGSPAWTSYNQWQIRFRWATGLTAKFYLHYLDANNYLLCQMQSTSLSLINVVAGSSTTIATNGSVALTNGMQYWLQITQFPFLPQIQTGTSLSGTTSGSFVQAIILADSAGVPNSTITTIGPAISTDTSQYTTGSTSSLNGRAQIAASGTTLAIGGNFSNVNQVQLFGPGGWTCTSSGSGQASGAWESYASTPNNPFANTYANGPVVSYNAGRIDCPPAGTVNCQWVSGGSGNLGNMILYGIPAIQTQVLGAYAFVNAPLVSSGCVISLGIIEYNSSGAQLTSGVVATHTGALATFTKLSGTYTVANASTNYCLIYINITDSTSGASANATMWWDDVCCWNQTITGMTTMPYCELRFPQAPSMFVASGLTGDMPAAALFSVGVNIGTTAWPNNRNANLFLGRRPYFSKYAQLVTPAYPFTVTGIQPTLATTAYGGFYLQTTSNATTQLATFPSLPSDTSGQNIIAGTYHAFSRMQITGAATPTAVSTTANEFYYGGGTLPTYAYPTQQPFSANSAWTLADLGQFFGNVSPPSTLIAQGNWVQPFVGCDSSSKTALCNYMALIPVDGEYFSLLATNTTSGFGGGWVHTYLDGQNRSCSYTVDTAAASNTPSAFSNVGVTTSVTSLGYSQPIVDPTLGGGINQFGFVAQDSAGNILPCCLEIIYSPQFGFTS